jgi:uncharacterized protein YxeA
MKKLYIFILLLTPFLASAQIDTVHYVQKSNTMRTDTLATNLLTLNQDTHTAEPMSGVTLKAYFQNGLQKQIAFTAGNGISITGTSPNYTISVVQPTIATTTRTLNSNFTVSTTKAAFLFYTVSVSVTNPLLAGTSVGTAFLEYSTNSGSTWNAVTSLGNSSSVGLAVTVALTNLQTGIIAGLVPANALCRIRTTTSGTATIAFVSSQEITY